jgi:hypothetical protein
MSFDDVLQVLRSVKDSSLDEAMLVALAIRPRNPMTPSVD